MTAKLQCYRASTNPATDYKVIAIDYKEWANRLLKQTLKDEKTIERLQAILNQSEVR